MKNEIFIFEKSAKREGVVKIVSSMRQLKRYIHKRCGKVEADGISGKLKCGGYVAAIL